ncbi:unnamed protein product [Darwinula stevensoni]|uniref:Uncharacterized protein n=1 Tax=Darwinula stevensoni TaxID=69355 RepID=A0A7R9ACE3_9CRUS|nr:unnamed protein product [Darwinula stevensoni]CAG0899950.1 unnamed protein product [Darwinula stevensoni]
MNRQEKGQKPAQMTTSNGDLGRPQNKVRKSSGAIHSLFEQALPAKLMDTQDIVLENQIKILELQQRTLEAEEKVAMKKLRVLAKEEVKVNFEIQVLSLKKQRLLAQCQDVPGQKKGQLPLMCRMSTSLNSSPLGH